MDLASVKTLVTVHANLEVTVTINQIPLSGYFSVKKENISNFLHRLHKLKGCEGVTTAELQAFAPLPSVNCTYYRHVLCSFVDGQMIHSSTVAPLAASDKWMMDLCMKSAPKSSDFSKKKI